MKTISFIIVLCLSSIIVHGQLKLKSVERNTSFNSETTVDEATGAILTEKIIPKEEYIVHAFSNVVYTRQEHLIGTEQNEPLKKYRLANGSAAEVASFQIPIYAQLTFFNSGAFALITLLGDGGGYGNEIRVYSNDFQLIQTFSPYPSGIRETSFHTDGQEMIIGISSFEKKNSKFMVIDDKGNLLIEKNVNPQEGEINRVYCQSGFYCINIINFEKPSNAIAMFNRNGNQLWNNAAFEPAQWCLTSSEKPILVTATINSLVLYDVLTGNQLDQRNYAAIYAEATKLRKDGYADVVSITNQANSNKVNVLLSEIEEKRGNLLYSFNGNFETDGHRVRISDSSERLKVRLAPTGLIIIKHEEVLKFAYTNEK
jgi:hypothetical protein